MSLIREINDLRREINALKHERQAQDRLNLKIFEKVVTKQFTGFLRKA